MDDMAWVARDSIQKSFADNFASRSVDLFKESSMQMFIVLLRNATV